MEVSVLLADDGEFDVKLPKSTKDGMVEEKGVRA